jgi:transposase
LFWTGFVASPALPSCAPGRHGAYYSWSKEFLEAGKRRLAGDTARAATSSEVTELRRQSRSLKEVVAEQALELRLLKKSMIADGEDGQ